ncbi:hypothetical protein J4464_04135 [Candidatus Woesearchaeota archaeon]|nr:hypothetical protein [Candidatus Woesearchaeota archaeon]
MPKKRKQRVLSFHKPALKRRSRKRRALPAHVFRDIVGYKHIKICKNCGKRFEDRYKARLYCDDCRK